jgi:GT2 family glycosyltransferase
MTGQIISAIVVNYKTTNLVTKLSQRLEKLAVDNIVVVDNTPDASLANCLPKEIEYIRSNYNAGYSGGNNIGVASVVEKSDYILILNPDVRIIDDGLIENLVDACELDSSIGIVSPNIITSRNSRDGSKIEQVLRFVGHLPKLPTEILEEIRFSSSVAGCAMMIDMNVWHTIGGFNEDFFMYREEVDYCYRAQKAGYLVGFSNSTEIVHDQSYTDFPHDDPHQMYYYIRNGFLLAQSSFNGIGCVVYIFLHISSLLVNLKRILSAGRLDLIKPYFFGVIDGILGRFGRRRYP